METGGMKKGKYKRYWFGLIISILMINFNLNLKAQKLGIIQISKTYEPDGYTVLLLHLDQDKGIYAKDFSKYSHRCKLHSIKHLPTIRGNTPPTWVKGGKFDGGLEFDGIDDVMYVEGSASPSSSLNITGPITVEFWLKLKGYPGKYPVYQEIKSVGLSKKFATLIHKEGSWRFYIDSEGILTFYIVQNKKRISVSWPLMDAVDNPIDEWIHIAGVYDGTKVRLYLNGEEKISKEATGPISASDKVIEIGASPNRRQYTNGVFDEIRISNVAREPLLRNR